MNFNIKIGTRGSKLALWQANHVANLLHENGVSTEIITIETKGDKNLNQPFSAIGTKGIFTEEIENKLLTGEIDIAVHSAKDMQSELPPGLEIIAFLERELPNDVLISNNKDINVKNIASYKIGTSSARRKAFLKHYYPTVEIVESRGNLQTRIKKMEDGHCDALILAYAGIHRMGYDHLIREKLSLDTFTPAVAQGSIAIECSIALENNKKNKVREILSDPTTWFCLTAERSFLRTLEGGCSIPIFCLATIDSMKIILHGGVVGLDGVEICRESISDSLSASKMIGIALAHKVLNSGGASILKSIREKKS